MKIGIISDTHGNAEAWDQAMEVFAGAELILHAGDVLYHPPRNCCQPGYDIPKLVKAINASTIPIVIARGNCDAEVYEELLKIPVMAPYAVVQHEGLRIVVIHGQGLSPLDTRELAEKYHADIFVTGHTHIPVVEKLNGSIHINPGSPALPKLERDGKPVPTVGLITDGKAQVVELWTGAEVASLALMQG